MTLVSVPTSKNVCKVIVANNLCIGCGLCAAICQNNNLRIESNELEEYIAVEKNNKCPDTCNICFRVCPFFGGEENEDTLAKKLFANTPEIKHTQETGYYIESFVGYSRVGEHRMHGASGGMITWVLEKLLKENIVDYVACVSSTKDTNKLFKFQLCKTTEDVRACARSAYYPVEVSEVIEYILSHEGRYAVTGLPCYCKGIRLAMQLNPKLQHRIKFVLGLACGQTKSKFFAEYICALGGGEASCLNSFTFRVKDPNRQASDFGMKFVCRAKKNQTQEGVVFWSEGIGPVWRNRFFTPNACNFCDDLFAELADMCFMDAWLPEYSDDWRGHSIILVRKSTFSNMLNEESEKNSISIKPLNIAKVIKSQESVLRSKRADMNERIRFARQLGQIVPKKRLFPGNTRLAFGEKKVVQVQFLLSQKSGREWLTARKQLASFRKKLKPDIVRLRRALFFKRLGHIPKAVARRLQKFLA